MKARECWSVLEGKAQQKVAKAQAEIVQARKMLQGLQASRERLEFLYEEYRAKSLATDGVSQGMQDAMNQRQFMSQLQSLRERVLQDIAQSEAALARLNQAMALAEAERMKMQTLDENEHTAVAAKMMKREQSRMDELGVMLFNRLSHS